MTKAKLACIKPVEHKYPSVAKALQDSATVALSTPIHSFALVTFHEDKECGVFWNCSSGPIDSIDLPDMVSSRLRNQISKVR